MDEDEVAPGSAVAKVSVPEDAPEAVRSVLVPWRAQKLRRIAAQLVAPLPPARRGRPAHVLRWRRRCRRREAARVARAGRPVRRDAGRPRGPVVAGAGRRGAF
jgi:hypothetical protein